jgi:hypothetical protein
MSTLPMTIHIHAWVLLECGTQEHCYPHKTKPDGWVVYRRIETPAKANQCHVYDFDDEYDFETLEQALKKAKEIAEMFDIMDSDIEHDY